MNDLAFSFIFRTIQLAPMRVRQTNKLSNPRQAVNLLHPSHLNLK